MKRKPDNYGACCGTIIGNQAKRIKELERELREEKEARRKAEAKAKEKPRQIGRSLDFCIMDEFEPEMSDEKRAAYAEAYGR